MLESNWLGMSWRVAGWPRPSAAASPRSALRPWPCAAAAGAPGWRLRSGRTRRKRELVVRAWAFWCFGVLRGRPNTEKVVFLVVSLVSSTKPPEKWVLATHHKSGFFKGTRLPAEKKEKTVLRGTPPHKKKNGAWRFPLNRKVGILLK